MSSLRTLAEEWSLDDAHLEQVLQVLRDVGLLVEAGTSSPCAGPAVTSGHNARIRIVGASDTGAQIAHLLARSGVPALDLVDPEPPGAKDLASAATRAEALAQALNDDEPGPGLLGPQIRVHNHWSKPEDRPVDLTILAADTWESDRVVTDGLLRSDQPHLVVRSRGDSVLVGPLVVPGRTACLRCTDLARTDADPAWPTLLTQLVRTRSRSHPTLTAWAAATAVSQVFAHLGQSSAETYGATLELSDADFLVRRRAWAAHPECGCAWDVTAEWGHEQRPG